MFTYLLNAAVLPLASGLDDAIVRVERITPEQARGLLVDGFVSAVGHQVTAEALARLLALPVPCERRAVFLAAGDRAVRMVFRGRLPEGKVLDAAELAALGYDLDLVTVLGAAADCWRRLRAATGQSGAWAAVMMKRAYAVELQPGPPLRLDPCALCRWVRDGCPWRWKRRVFGDRCPAGLP